MLAYEYEHLTQAETKNDIRTSKRTKTLTDADGGTVGGTATVAPNDDTSGGGGGGGGDHSFHFGNGQTPKGSGRTGKRERMHRRRRS